MNPNEILPSPNQTGDSSESSGYGTEITGAQSVERKSDSSAAGLSPVSDDATATLSDDQQQSQGGQAVSNTTATTSTSQFDVPENAEDLDLIEKEWVKKAKDIVHNTTGDPHKQTNQINKMKVEYIKKRYNKDIKFKEE